MTTMTKQAALERLDSIIEDTFEADDERDAANIAAIRIAQRALAADILKRE